jgi:hypothetical protein
LGRLTATLRSENKFLKSTPAAASFNHLNPAPYTFTTSKPSPVNVVDTYREIYALNDDDKEHDVPIPGRRNVKQLQAQDALFNLNQREFGQIMAVVARTLASPCPACKLYAILRRKQREKLLTAIDSIGSPSAN